MWLQTTKRHLMKRLLLHTLPGKSSKQLQQQQIKKWKLIETRMTFERLPSHNNIMIMKCELSFSFPFSPKFVFWPLGISVGLMCNFDFFSFLRYHNEHHHIGDEDANNDNNNKKQQDSSEPGLVQHKIKACNTFTNNPKYPTTIILVQ